MFFEDFGDCLSIKSSKFAVQLQTHNG